MSIRERFRSGASSTEARTRYWSALDSASNLSSKRFQAHAETFSGLASGTQESSPRRRTTSCEACSLDDAGDR